MGPPGTGAHQVRAGEGERFPGGEAKRFCRTIARRDDDALTQGNFCGETTRSLSDLAAHWSSKSARIIDGAPGREQFVRRPV